MTTTPGTAGERRADALRRAAQAKRQAAITRADTAIRKLVKNREEITFRSVARAAGVSLDFLYGNDDLRERIEKLRAQQTARPAREPAAAAADHDDIVHILTSSSARNETPAAPRAAASSSSPPPTANFSGYAACCTSTASAPDHVTDASATSLPAEK